MTNDVWFNLRFLKLFKKIKITGSCLVFGVCNHIWTVVDTRNLKV